MSDNTSSEDSSCQAEASIKLLESWLGKFMKITIPGDRILLGNFACTDRDANVVLENCWEYTKSDIERDLEPRMLGLAFIPGKFILSAEIQNDDHKDNSPNTTPVQEESS